MFANKAEICIESFIEAYIQPRFWLIFNIYSTNVSINAVYFVILFCILLFYIETTFHIFLFWLHYKNVSKTL